ncbi:MAG: YqhA family protein [bacterium]
MTDQEKTGVTKKFWLENFIKKIFIKYNRVPLKHLLSLNMFFVMLGIACLAISSILTFLKAFVETMFFVSGEHEFIEHILPKFMIGHLPTEFNAVLCKILETSLIGVILFICAVGLYFLFWKDINVPHWLQFTDVNQLKEKLIGIIVTVLGVTFLEHTLEWSNPNETLMYGAAISMIIIVLVVYMKVLTAGHHAERHKK